jgi:hypothetical protein
MKNLSTGTGIALLAGAIVSFPFINNIASNANASAVTAAAATVSTAATAQTGPTIVWYGVAHQQAAATWGYYPYTVIARAWSDGRLEVKKVCSGATCGDPISGGFGWVTVSTANMGFNAASDINFDEKVDGADLTKLFADWGDAPRQDIPSSDCPLALINP